MRIPLAQPIISSLVIAAGLLGCDENEIAQAPAPNQQEIHQGIDPMETARTSGTKLVMLQNDPGLIAPPTTLDSALEFYDFTNTEESVTEIQNIVDSIIELKLIKPSQLLNLQKALSSNQSDQGKLKAASIELLEIRQKIFNHLVDKKDLNQTETELLTKLLDTNPQHYALLLFEQYGLAEYQNEAISEAVNLFSALHHNITKAYSHKKITAREAIQASQGRMDGSEETGFDNIQTIKNYLQWLNEGRIKAVRPGEKIPQAPQFEFDAKDQRPGEPKKLEAPGYGWRKTTTQLTTGEDQDQAVKQIDSIVISQEELFEIIQNNFSLAH